MVEVEEEVLEKLKKDANDNNAIVRLAKIIALLVLGVIIVFIYGTRLIDISLEQYRASVECQIEITKAENNVHIREIESAGISTEDYLRWLEVTSNDKTG